jgi:hypothetical protein
MSFVLKHELDMLKNSLEDRSIKLLQTDEWKTLVGKDVYSSSKHYIVEADGQNILLRSTNNDQTLYITNELLFTVVNSSDVEYAQQIVKDIVILNDTLLTMM